MPDNDRRRFLRTLTLTAGALTWPGAVSGAPRRQEARTSQAPDQTTEIIDTNVYVGNWPFHRLRADSPAVLVDQLRSHGVTQAWTGTFDGLFQKDIRRLNAHLAETCQRYGDGLLVPFGTVNPQLTDWEEDLRLIAERYEMPGIRIHPNYQNYALDDASFIELLERAARYNLIVQLVPWMEDERHHHTEMPVATVDLSPLPAALAEVPDVQLVLLNGFRAVGGLPEALLSNDNVYFDFSKLDVLLGLRALIDEVPVERILFGSFSPMFYFEQAPLKMKESAVTDTESLAIYRENAQQLLRLARS